MIRLSPIARAWGLAAIWTAMIVLESFAGSAENTGRILRPLLEFIFGPLHRNTFYVIHNFLRKGGHFFGYSILSFTLYRAWWTTLAAGSGADQLSWRDMFRSWSGRAVLLALVGTLIV